ncbi:MAG: alanine racemase [Deltaproteobacteria bacterium]|jgi:alanine racemase|nr:alanine racemase [Deltaproteobacteria bacterium]
MTVSLETADAPVDEAWKKSSFNSVEIDLGALADNYRLLARHVAGRLMPVVKGDAYGHGLTACARTLVEAGAADLGVLDVAEAERLRADGVQAELHILAGLHGPEQMDAALKIRARTLIYSRGQLEALGARARALGLKAAGRLKVDTGMGRLGVPWPEAPAVIESLAEQSDVVVEGLATHLATSGDVWADRQLERFAALAALADRRLGRPLRHSALASGGLLTSDDGPGDLSRPGLLIYGVSPLAADDPALAARPAARALVGALRPAMSFKSLVVQTRKVRAGETISYDRTFEAPADLTAAVAPAGYVHGLSRRRSSRGWGLIEGRRVPLLGRVCMNLTVWDVSGLDRPADGQALVLLGRSGEAAVDAVEAAAWQDTNAYELLCLLGRLNPRTYRPAPSSTNPR